MIVETYTVRALALRATVRFVTEQIGSRIIFSAFFTTGGLGTAGLTVTWDVYRGATQVVAGAAATEIGGGIYRYSLDPAHVTTEEIYYAIAKTATTGVDAREIAMAWPVGVGGIEHLDAAISGIPSASAIADAVLDEALEDHVTAGTPGAALAAAEAAGDPWETPLPGDYAEGTAGELIGKLAPATPETPAVVPEPPADSSLCTVYLYTEDLTNQKKAGIAATFKLSGAPSASERALEKATVTATTDADGFLSIVLQRTDTLTPAGRYYLVNVPEIGIKNAQMVLEADTYDLRGLIA